MKRIAMTLVAIAALGVTTSAKGDGALRCTLTGKTIASCCCETGKNGKLHCTLANKDIETCCCEPAKPGK